MKERTKSMMRAIMREDELQRIHFQDLSETDMKVIADVHGMKRVEARRFIRNIIAVVRDAFFLLVIHGYNRGTALRDMIRGGMLQSPRISEIMEVDRNPGATMLAVGPA